VFGIPVTLIVYGIMALGAVAVFGGFVLLERTAGADVQKAADAPVMLLCQTPLNAHGAKDCAAKIQQSVADVATLAANNHDLTATIGRQNDAMNTLALAGIKARADARAAQKQSDDDAEFYVQRLQGLKQNLQYPSKEPNADADRILRALALDRLSGK
jgi:hypothetical protein